LDIEVLAPLTVAIHMGEPVIALCVLRRAFWRLVRSRRVLGPACATNDVRRFESEAETVPDQTLRLDPASTTSPIQPQAQRAPLDKTTVFKVFTLSMLAEPPIESIAQSQLSCWGDCHMGIGLHCVVHR
jgi:hypothetical protein